MDSKMAKQLHDFQKDKSRLLRLVAAGLQPQAVAWQPEVDDHGDDRCRGDDTTSGVVSVVSRGLSLSGAMSLPPTHHADGSSISLMISLTKTREGSA